MMNKVLAYCGLLCNQCDAYIATRNNDQALKEKIAKEWSTEKYPLKVEDIYCDGCTAEDSKVLSFCRDCDMRACAREKVVEHCGKCDVFPCEMMEKQMERTPECRERLVGHE